MVCGQMVPTMPGLHLLWFWMPNNEYTMYITLCDSQNMTYKISEFCLIILNFAAKLWDEVSESCF
jgi:hypothetical protein